jgi:hypothetical protein
MMKIQLMKFLGIVAVLMLGGIVAIGLNPAGFVNSVTGHGAAIVVSVPQPEMAAAETIISESERSRVEHILINGKLWRVTYVLIDGKWLRTSMEPL